MKYHIPNWITVMKEILISNNPYILDLARKTNITYSHIAKIIYHLKEDNLVTVTKKGRTMQIVLTEKGQKVAAACNKLIGLSYDLNK
jgi:predicted transcriptional regulator